MKKSELFFTAVLVPLDFVMLVGAGLASYFLRTSFLIEQYRPVLFYLDLSFGRYFILNAGFSLFLLVIFASVGLYKIKSIRPISEDFLKIIIGVSAGVFILVFYIFLSREWFNSRFLILSGWITAIIFVTFGRFLINRLRKYLIKKHHFNTQPILVIGGDRISQRIIQTIKQNPDLGYDLVTNLVEPDLYEIKAKVGNPGIEEIILADLNWSKEKILELINFCEESHIVFKFVPNLFQTLTANASVETLGNLPLVELKRTALDGWGRIIKRTIDLLGSCLGLIFLSPLLIIIAFIIKWESDGPVLVRLKRISQGKEFELFKFRSMIKNAEEFKKFLLVYNERTDGPLFKIKDDPRVTKIGRILRKYRIDELPQLINVLTGEISLVGPRPHQPDEIEQYQKHHKKVLAIKSGMTGFAQAHGSSDLPFEEEIKLDTYYVENWSLWLDFNVLIRTFFILLKDGSAC